MSINLLDQLNSQQNEAVVHTDGPSVILAGAGSGKTRVLIHKVLYLITEKKVHPLSIVMITFTNKAAGEMKERVARASDLVDGGHLGYIGTFHSFCAQILRREGMHIGLDPKFTIYDDDDQVQLLKTILKKYEKRKITPSYLQFRISQAKNQLLPPERYLSFFSDYNASAIAELYSMYQKELEKNQAVDFDDIIMKTTMIFNKFPEVLDKYHEKYKYFLIDEFQDTNFAQYVLSRQLASKYNNITVVGDFAQSIYSWRGADIRNLEKFRTDFPDSKVFNLEQNYRSTQNILNFAYDIISKNQTHPVLQLFTANIAGEEVTIFETMNEQDEAVFVASEIQRLKKNREYTDFAILYRTNAQSRVIEEAFLHFGIPYTLIGGTRFYDRKEIKDVLSYLRLYINPKDEVARERVEKIGKKKYDKFMKFFEKQPEVYEQVSTIELMEAIFKETGYLELYDRDDPEDYSRLENIKELKSVAVSFPKLVNFLEQVALVESEYFEKERRQHGKEGVKLMTLHQAKGLEFPYVFIVGVEEGILPHVRSIDDIFQLEEERRLFYVGITRAQKKLYITFTQRRFIFGRRNETTKSRFIRNGEETSNYY